MAKKPAPLTIKSVDLWPDAASLPIAGNEWAGIWRSPEHLLTGFASRLASKGLDH